MTEDVVSEGDDYDALVASLIEFAEYNATPNSDVGIAAYKAREQLKLRRRIALRELKQRREDGWRPIESAPRDGRQILVGYFNYEGEWKVHEAWWRMPYESAPAKSCWWCHDKDGTLLSADIHVGSNGKRLGATHWRPLPAPPVEPARCATCGGKGYTYEGEAITGRGPDDVFPNKVACEDCSKEPARGEP